GRGVIVVGVGEHEAAGLLGLGLLLLLGLHLRGVRLLDGVVDRLFRGIRNLHCAGSGLPGGLLRRRLALLGGRLLRRSLLRPGLLRSGGGLLRGRGLGLLGGVLSRGAGGGRLGSGGLLRGGLGGLL